MKLLAFYRGEGTDGRGRRLAEILAWADDDLEDVHDYIQWLFPLPEPSPVNPGAPLLDAKAIAEFRSDAELRARLLASFTRMLRFYGVAIEGGSVHELPNCVERAKNWLSPGNHNHLRITRILRCAALCGLQTEACAFFEWLSIVYDRQRAKTWPAISPNTFDYWRNAVSAAAGR